MAFDVTELLQVEDIGRCDCRLSRSPGTSQADDMKKQPSWQDLLMGFCWLRCMRVVLASVFLKVEEIERRSNNKGL